MVYNDTSTSKNGLIQSCETWLFGSEYGAISGNTNNLATFTRLLNKGLDKSETAILEADGRWQYGDTNYTTHPIATANLVDNQQDYGLSVTHMKILAIEVKDNDGNWHTLSPIDMQDIRRKGMALTEFMEEAGFPRYYDVFGESLFLYPKPSNSYVTLTAGLKVYFQREPDYFATDDTTKEPGLPRIFDDLPVIYACDDYAKANQMTEKARELDAEIVKREAQLSHFYSTRHRDSKTTLKARYKSSI